MKLSERLKKCAYMVSEKSNIADIGTDHAYLPIFLAIENKIISAIACDFREGPLKIAQKNIKKFGLENIIETRFSDGLQRIHENEVDTVIIAGMGGITIINILNQCKWKNKENKIFILNPMSSENELREFLDGNGYEITKETAVLCSGKIYTIMLVKFTGIIKKTDRIYNLIGKICENDDEATKIYIQKQLADLENRKKGAEIRNDKNKSTYYRDLIQQIKSLLREN